MGWEGGRGKDREEEVNSTKPTSASITFCLVEAGDLLERLPVGRNVAEAILSISGSILFCFMFLLAIWLVENLDIPKETLHPQPLQMFGGTELI